MAQIVKLCCVLNYLPQHYDVTALKSNDSIFVWNIHQGLPFLFQKLRSTYVGNATYVGDVLSVYIKK